VSTDTITKKSIKEEERINMVYRPSVRYAEAYEKYVKELDESTHLDRNQIIRLALFMAAHSQEYQSILEKYKKPGVSLPQPCWEQDDDRLWKNQNYIPKQKKQEMPKRGKTIKIINKGGIKYVPIASPPPSETVRNVTL
jgi:hypothetical protein